MQFDKCPLRSSLFVCFEAWVSAQAAPKALSPVERLRDSDYQDDGESDTDPRNSDFQWKERPIAYKKPSQGK